MHAPTRLREIAASLRHKNREAIEEREHEASELERIAKWMEAEGIDYIPSKRQSHDQ